MLTNLTIDIEVLHYNGEKPEVETITITEMDLLTLAKNRVLNSYPMVAQPKEIFPSINKVEFYADSGTKHFTSEMEFVQYD